MPSVEVIDLKKSYPLYLHKTDKIKEAFSITRKKYHKDFEALKGINFKVEAGECVGIIGLNGSGKSTLLKIINGIIKQTSGSVKVNGKVAALLELGAGFNPEYTGIENIYLNTLLLGLTKEETDKRLDEILEFADIGDFVYQPVKLYSSGMYVRLAFAIAVAVSPDVLIIDEALSVGDVFFQQKCYAKIREMARTATVIIVSHDLNALTKFCKRILVLHNGVLVFDGEAKDAITEYYKVRQGQITKDSGENQANGGFALANEEDFVAPETHQYSGKMDMRIEKYYYQVDDVPFAEYCEKGNRITVALLVRSSIRVDNLIVGYQVLDRYGSEVFGETNVTSDMGSTRDLYDGKSVITFCFDWPEVRDGDYFVTLGLGNGYEVLNQVEQCWVNQAIHLVNTTRGKLIYGLFNNKMEDFAVERIGQNG